MLSHHLVTLTSEQVKLIYALLQPPQAALGEAIATRRSVGLPTGGLEREFFQVQEIISALPLGAATGEDEDYPSGTYQLRWCKEDRGWLIVNPQGRVEEACDTISTGADLILDANNEKPFLVVRNP